MSNAIEVSGLTKRFKENEVLTGINLSVPKGTIFALLGPNGAGKTTLVRILTTLLLSDGGTATVNGINVSEDPDGVRSTIGLVGQNAAVDEKLSGIANLQMIGELYHLSAADAKRRAHELIEQFDLVDAAKRPVKTYSGGMRRRLDLAASIIVTPPVLFLDEPTTGLDPRSRTSMWSVIRDIVAGGSTLFLTTQYLEEADQLADQIAVLDHGTIIAQGTASQLKQSLGSSRLVLTYKKEADATKAAELLSDAKVGADKLSVTVELRKGFSQLADATQQLKTAKLMPEDVQVHEPTLDDVFLSLTGEPTKQ